MTLAKKPGFVSNSNEKSLRVYKQTKVIYYVNGGDTPHAIKIPVSSDTVTLGDLKNTLNRPNAKFFFRTTEGEIGVVKVEISDDTVKLPTVNGRLVSWVFFGDSSDKSIECSKQKLFWDNSPTSSTPTTETNGTETTSGYAMNSTSTVTDMSTKFQLESSEDIQSSIDDIASLSKQLSLRSRRKSKRKSRVPITRKTTFSSSLTKSSMSLSIISIELNLRRTRFLGMTIAGQSNQRGDRGIFVASVTRGGAAALDGRIHVGDMILQVNNVSFENMSNDEAVEVLKEAVQNDMSIRLVVAKSRHLVPRGCFAVPHSDPLDPIDTGAWIAHTNAAMRSSVELFSEKLASSSTPEKDRKHPSDPVPTKPQDNELKVETDDSGVTDENPGHDEDMQAIVKLMAGPKSGLDVRDRTWLKMTIPSAFLGSDAVDWLRGHVKGLSNRKAAKKCAAKLLEEKHITHPMQKCKFSEQCYYVFSCFS